MSIGCIIALPTELEGRHHVYNQFVLRFTEGQTARDRVMQHLKASSIGCEVYYPLTLPQQECFHGVSNAADAFPNSDAAAQQSLEHARHTLRMTPGSQVEVELNALVGRLKSGKS